MHLTKRGFYGTQAVHSVMTKGLVAQASVTVNASLARVWDSLVNPEAIKKYMFGTEVVSDWKEGSPIIWRGEWQGTRYEDKGTILKLEPPRLIQYTHFSPLSGLQDVPENYRNVTIQTSTDGMSTLVTLTQDNNTTQEMREHSKENWEMVLEGLKKLVEAK